MYFLKPRPHKPIRRNQEEHLSPCPHPTSLLNHHPSPCPSPSPAQGSGPALTCARQHSPIQTSYNPMERHLGSLGAKYVLQLPWVQHSPGCCWKPAAMQTPSCPFLGYVNGLPCHAHPAGILKAFHHPKQGCGRGLSPRGGRRGWGCMNAMNLLPQVKVLP